MTGTTQGTLSPAAFKEKYGPWAVIAGASHGAGVAYAQQVAAMGINVMLVALTAEELGPVAAEVRAKHGVQTRLLAQDLMELDAAEKMLKASADLDVGLYISNAGSLGKGSYHFLDRPVEHWRQLNIMNVVTVMEALHGFGRIRFLKRGRGGIIVMSSNAALRALPNMAVYSATKGYEMLLVEALWIELQGTDVDILASLCPAMDTPTFRKGVEPEALAQMEAANLIHQPSEIVKEALAHLPYRPLNMFRTGMAVDPEAVREERFKMVLATVDPSRAAPQKSGKG